MKQLLPLFGAAVFLSSALTLSVTAAETSPPSPTAPGKSYNVIFIAVDDLNDWVGAFGGHPQAITPNLDRLANERAMVMNKAYAGAEELYDHATDPLERNNLAAHPASQEIIARFQPHLPAHNEPAAPRNTTGDGDKKAQRKGGKAQQKS